MASDKPKQAVIPGAERRYRTPEERREQGQARLRLATFERRYFEAKPENRQALLDQAMADRLLVSKMPGRLRKRPVPREDGETPARLPREGGHQESLF